MFAVGVPDVGVPVDIDGVVAGTCYVLHFLIRGGERVIGGVEAPVDENEDGFLAGFVFKEGSSVGEDVVEAGAVLRHGEGVGVGGEGVVGEAFAVDDQDMGADLIGGILQGGGEPANRARAEIRIRRKWIGARWDYQLAALFCKKLLLFTTG